jgi:hypothetical protein
MAATKKTTKKNKTSLSRRVSSQKPLVFAAIFAVLGIVTLLASHADPKPKGTCTPHPASITIYNNLTPGTISPGLQVKAGVPATLNYEAIDGGLYCGTSTQNVTITSTLPAGSTITPSTATVALKESSPTYYQYLSTQITAAPGTPPGAYTGTIRIVNAANPALNYSTGFSIFVN